MQPNEYEIPEEKLKEWEQAESKATPGPWAGSMCCVTKNNAFVIGCNSCSVHGANHDAKFVALSRNALPLLLKAYRKQREEIERLNKGYDALSKMMVTWVKDDQEKQECQEK
jgi:hypothetical protein